MTDLVQVQGLSKHYPVHRGALGSLSGVTRALDGVDLSLRRGECLAVVGESGSGKSTLGRCVMALTEPTAGRVVFDGVDLASLSKSDMRRKRREFQMVFQDPVGCLNPRQTVGDIVLEPLEVHDLQLPSERQERVLELLSRVGVPISVERHFPHELSGGQRQRVAIARALASEPRLLVADEPVSALDVSLRGQIVNLLVELIAKWDLTVLFIAHDLALVERISNRVAVMYAGKIVELAATEQIFRQPQHPYTASLLSAMPETDPALRRRRIVLSGEPPNPAALPRGCRFHPRCPIVRDRCREDEPVAAGGEDGFHVSCHYPGELDWRGDSTSSDGTF
jgi:oligopeptide transport system ATP-binding protein